MILVCNSNIKRFMCRFEKMHHYPQFPQNPSTRKPVEILIIIAINLSGEPSNKASIKDNDWKVVKQIVNLKSLAWNISLKAFRLCVQYCWLLSAGFRLAMTISSWPLINGFPNSFFDCFCNGIRMPFLHCFCLFQFR